ncbi:outer membrane protein [uncultured Gammaproteobacteria bacterium]
MHRLFLVPGRTLSRSLNLFARRLFARRPSPPRSISRPLAALLVALGLIAGGGAAIAAQPATQTQNARRVQTAQTVTPATAAPAAMGPSATVPSEDPGQPPSPTTATTTPPAHRPVPVQRYPVQTQPHKAAPTQAHPGKVNPAQLQVAQTTAATPRSMAGRQPVTAKPTAATQNVPDSDAVHDNGEALLSAIGLAYTTNPTLDADRARLRAVDEGVPQALSAARPTLQGTGSLGGTRAEALTSRDHARPGGTTAAANGTTTNSGVIGAEVVQPIYRGGRISAGISSAENAVQAQRASLLLTEQTVLLDAATAYMDLVRDEAVLKLNINNEQVLQRQLEAARDRFRVGEITRTDVSQAESRMARSTSDRIQSEGQLRSTRATYIRSVGQAPTRIVKPKITLPLPGTMDETVELARNTSPSVIAAAFTEAAARDSISSIEGERLPEVALRAGITRQRDVISARSNEDTRNDITDTTSGTIRATITIPLYSGGSLDSRSRQARQTAAQRRIQVNEARTKAEENAIKAWQSLVTARASIQSRQAQVSAAEIALEGVRQEATVGSRTVLDTLNAEQEFLDARVALVRAERDESVAVFTVLTSIGRFTAGELNLQVQRYDIEAHYRAVRDRWWGGIEE